MMRIDIAMTTLLNGIWQGAILAAAMWLLLKLLPRLNPTTRFTVLWLTMGAVLALPIGTVTPRMSIPEPQTDSSAIAGRNTPAATTLTPIESRQSEWKTARAETQLESVPASRPGTEWAQARNGASRNLSTATAPLAHSPIRIRSERVLQAFEIAWALLSLVMLVRLGVGYRELRLLKSGATPATDKQQVWLMGLCAKNGVRRQIRLLVSTHIRMPMSLGFVNPAVLIPRSLLDALSELELEHIVLHELSHLKRRDDWTNLAQKFIEVVLPIQPAIYWIGRRMSLEREMACDDWVIAATGTASRYASSITRVAELSPWGNVGSLAAGAAGNRSQLLRRVHHMLDRTGNSAPKLALGPLVVAVVAVVALLFLSARAPQMIVFAQNPADSNSRQGATAQTQAPYAMHSRTPPGLVTPLATQAGAATVPLQPRTSLALVASLAPTAPVASQQSGGQHTEMITRDGWTSLSVKIDGTIEFTDDDYDVESLSPNGHFRIEARHWLSSRAYDVKADSAGNLTKTYSVGGTTKSLDDEGHAWLRQSLPQIIRDSGIGAGPRVARILRHGGAQAVLNEIGLIHSDGSKRIYLEQLFSQATLRAVQLKDAAKLIQGISSDGDKAHVIITLDDKYFTGELRPHLFDAAESISSDGDKRRVLSDFVSKDAGSGETLVRVAKAAKHISSDGDKAEVLILVADSYRATDDLRPAYFDAVNSISSDGDHARVLLKLLVKHGDDGDTLTHLLQSAGKISSDGDKGRVLKDAVSRYRDEEPVRKAFFDAANSISSDGDHQQVLVTLVHRQGNQAATLGGIANSARGISSDGDKARVLVELADGNVESVRDAFFAAADSIHSDGDHSHVLMAVLDKPGTSSVMVVAAIQSATRISSDGDMGRVLLDAADRYSGDSGVNAALRKAVESLHSDGEYRAVMSKITQPRGSI
jgi:beta-lactamase regulating signal transducer with metallopeptidase domain